MFRNSSTAVRAMVMPCLAAGIIFGAGAPLLAAIDGQEEASDDAMKETVDAVAGDVSDKEILQTQNCIKTYQIDRTDIVDDTAILFYMKGSTIYLNKLPRRCSMLKINGAFGYRVVNTTLCNVDIITVAINYGNALRSGPGCGLGKFQPITEEQVEMIKEFGPADF